MCGVAAVWGKADGALARDMVLRLSHRGPDGRGVESMGSGALAQTRLAILDLAGGRQPMFNERGDLALAFNGEIYNYRELRASLEPRHTFRTRTDTEVILHLYEEEGEDMLARLDGMFAFALQGPRGMLLARDPLGIKPLYYGRAGSLLLAASELKALPPMDEVRCLPAGHFALAPAWGEEEAPAMPEPVPYCAPVGTRPLLAIPPLEEILSEVRRRLELAVRKRLMSDVPVGVFLSGGLDSSLVAALMKPACEPLHSFTAGMAGAPDLEAARQVAAFLGTEHHELVYTEKDVAEALPTVIRHLESFDAPLVRSAVPNFFIARLASRHVKVVLTGEGADELFAGYAYLRKEEIRQDLRAELDRITERLQDTNLQRGDRMTMAFGLEARVPFLDLGLLRYVSRLPVEFLAPRKGFQEKSLLREACKDTLPPEILRRPKMKFSEGAGSAEVVAQKLAAAIPPEEYERERDPAPGFRLRSPEELLYYRIWRETMGDRVPLSLVGRTRDASAAAGGPP